MRKTMSLIMLCVFLMAIIPIASFGQVQPTTPINTNINTNEQPSQQGIRQNAPIVPDEDIRAYIRQRLSTVRSFQECVRKAAGRFPNADVQNIRSECAEHIELLTNKNQSIGAKNRELILGRIAQKIKGNGFLKRGIYSKILKRLLAENLARWGQLQL